MADTYRRLFQQKTVSLWKKLWFFGLFSGDKGDNIHNYVDDQNYSQSKSNLYECFTYFKSR